MTPSPEFLTHHAALIGQVGFADLSGRTQLEIHGTDRAAFLHSFCTNDVKQLISGRGCEAFITSPQGKTLGHVLIFCHADRLLLDTSPGQAAVLTTHFDKYLISEDVQFVDRTAEQGELLVVGGQAAEMLQRLTGRAPPADILSFVTAPIAGREITVCCVEFAGPLSFFLQAQRPDLAAVADALATAGAVQCGREAVEAARLEAGVPLYGHDITDDNLPQEVGRSAQAISFTKGCYLGQETVARIDALGHVNRSLVGLKFASRDVPTAGTPLLAGDKEVGKVTSAAWSPRLQTPLAMGYVRRMHSAKGTTLASPSGAVEVVSLPVSAG